MNLLWLKEGKWLGCNSSSEAEFILISVQWSFLNYVYLFIYMAEEVSSDVEVRGPLEGVASLLLRMSPGELTQVLDILLAPVQWFFFRMLFSFSGVLWYYLLKSTCAILCVHIQMAELTRTQISDAIGASGVSLTALYDHQRQHLPDFMKQLRTKAETDRYVFSRSKICNEVSFISHAVFRVLRIQLRAYSPVERETFGKYSAKWKMLYKLR